MKKIHLLKAKAPKLLICGVLIMASFALTACDAAQNTLKPDREASLEIQDYRDSLASRIADDLAEDKASKVDIPTLQPYIASGSTDMKSMPLVSLSVNQSVPLRDILFELAKQADYDLELDPNIRGSIIFTARNRPFDQVIERIAGIAGLRYSFENDVLRVEEDNPYSKLYKIDYLSYVRSSASGISNDISVVSGDGTDTGSSFTASSETEINFWGELENNLEQILGGQTTGALKTRRDPTIQATAPNPTVETTDGQAVEANVTFGQVPTDETDDTSAANDNVNVQTFTLNKQAGLVNVFGTDKAHKDVAEYLKQVKKAVTSQVLIEAKILEVTLNDTYATGVDWRAIDLFGSESALNFFTAAGNTGLNTLASGLGSTANLTVPGIDSGVTTKTFAAGIAGNDVQALITALSQFGTVKALASPRMTVLNNQPAVMNVATNVVFFDIDIDTSVDDDTGDRETDIDADAQNVPVGVLVNVQPSINLEDRTVSLALRPTITSISQRVENPAIDFISQTVPGVNVSSPVPELNVQEVDSVIKVNDKQPIVMGGLLQDVITTNQNSVPILGEIPYLGAAFRDDTSSIQKTELIIFLKATILDSASDSVHATDKDLYRKFSSDRRPMRF